MRIEIECAGASAEQLRAGRLAANRVLMLADLPILAVWLAVTKWGDWDGSPRAEGGPSLDERLMLQALQMAEEAANEAMGLFPGGGWALLGWSKG